MQPSPTTREQFVELVDAHQGILHRICWVIGGALLVIALTCSVVWGIKVWLSATP